MSDDIAIKVDHVSKTFKLPHEKQTSIKGALINKFKGGNRSYERQQVLKDVSFEIKKGEFFGIVGRNGSGKSTLLKMLAGIYTPTKGTVHVNGKLTPFIELGVGFNPELTGRENVFLNGALLGFNRAEMNAMYDDIVAFAELGKFMDQKLKNYSSGMQVRLAFSIAIRAKSDILLIDEVLAVGDAAFQAKCFDYFYELKKTDVTVIFVSHDRGSLERFCDRGVLIHDGDLLVESSIDKVLNEYSNIVLEELSHSATTEANNEPKVHYVSIENVHAYSTSSKPKQKFIYGEKIRVSFEVVALQPIENPIIGVTLWAKNLEERAVFATNTLIENWKDSGSFRKGDRAHFSVELPHNLNDGEYYVEPAVANESASTFYSKVPRAATIYVNGSRNPHSLLSATPRSVNYVKEDNSQ